VITFVESDPEITEVNGLMRLDFLSGADALPIAMSIHTLRMLVAKATRVLNEEDERSRQKVVSFGRG
jgi:hypothetical protein